jgi:hypothetical protein
VAGYEDLPEWQQAHAAYLAAAAAGASEQRPPALPMLHAALRLVRIEEDWRSERDHTGD